MKRCRLCNLEKPLPDFPLSKIHKSGYRNECKECRRKLARVGRKKYYQANLERCKQYQAEYRERKKQEKSVDLENNV